MPDLPSPTVPVKRDREDGADAGGDPVRLGGGGLVGGDGLRELGGVDGAARMLSLMPGKFSAPKVAGEKPAAAWSSLGADPHDLGVERDAGEDEDRAARRR